MRKAVLATLLFALAGTAQAHEIWVERDGDGPVRVYLGEPAEALPEGGDPEFEKLKAPKLLDGTAATFARKPGFLEASLPAGDVRIWDDGVFAPWGAEGKKEGVVYYARAGRADTRTLLPVEIAPLTANGNRFVLRREGKPVPGSKVTIISPDKWSKVVTTDAQGMFDVPLRERGRYLLSAALKDEGDLRVAGGTVQVLHRITTTSFVAN